MNCFPDSKSSTNSMLKANLGGIGFFLYVVNFVETRNYFVTVWPSRHRCKRFWICVAHARVGVSGFLSDWMLISGVYRPFLSDTFPRFSCYAHLSQGPADQCWTFFHFSCYAHLSQGSTDQCWTFSHFTCYAHRSQGSLWPFRVTV